MSIFKITRSRKATVNQTTKYYKTNKSITLVAPMQSGKTSTYFDVAIDAIKNGIVKKIVIFSGNRETMLRDQTMDRVSKNELLKDVTEVVWGPDLKKYNPDIFTNTLYIWDESHYGQSDEQEVDNFCSKCGICPLGLDSFQSVYYLSVSATPFDILEAAEHNQDIQIVEGVRPNNYFGITEMLELRLVEDNSDFEAVISHPTKGGIVYLLTEKMQEYMNHLNRFEFGLGIIRMSKLQEGERLREVVNGCYSGEVTPILIGCGSGCDYNIREGIARVEQHVCNEGKKILLIVVNALSAGKDLGRLKQYTRFCIEMRSKQIANAVQGLPGRICGYHNNRDIKVMAKLEILEHYAEFENDYEKFYDSNWRQRLATLNVYQISTQVSLKWTEKTGRKCKVLSSQEFSLDDLRNPGTWKYLPEELYCEPTKRDALMELFEPAFYNNPQKGFKLRIPDVNVRIYTNYGQPKDNRVAKLWNKANKGDDYYTITFMKKDYKAGILISNLPPDHPKNAMGFQGIKVVWPDTPYISKGTTEMTNGSMYN